MRDGLRARSGGSDVRPPAGRPRRVWPPTCGVAQHDADTHTHRLRGDPPALSQTDDPEASGIRIAPGPETPEGTALELSLVEEPEPADEKVDDDGATVYLEPHVAGFLDDKVLDAQVDEGRVTFLVRDDDVPPEPEDYATPNGNGPS